MSTVTYFVKYAFMNLIMKSKMAMQNSKLSPVQTPGKPYTMLFVILELMTYCRKHFVSWIQLQIK